MKKIFLFALGIIFSLSVSNAFGSNADLKSKSDNTSVADKKETKLSEEEIANMTKRVEEIRDMDKSNLTAKEKRDLKKEVREIKRNVRKDDIIVISSGTALLIILILLCI
jgi:hypothetical protein